MGAPRILSEGGKGHRAICEGCRYVGRMYMQRARAVTALEQHIRSARHRRWVRLK